MRERAGRIASIAVSIALIGVMAAPAVGHAQSWRTVTMSRQHTSEETLDVEVSFGAGRLTVHPGDDLLYRMSLRYDEEVFEPLVDYESGVLQVGLEGTGGAIRLARNHSGGELDLALSRDVVIELDMEFGAVRSDIELGGLSLRSLSLSTGASESIIRVSEPNPVAMERARLEAGAADFEARSLGNLNAERIDIDAGLGDVTLAFDGAWQRDARVGIDLGVGSLELVFPRGLGVRLRQDSFLTSLDAQGLIKDGDWYHSPDWDDAERRITVEVDAALGDIDVRWIDP